VTTEQVMLSRCDRCGETARQPMPESGEARIAPPDGWTRIATETGGPANETLDFCPGCSLEFEEWHNATVDRPPMPRRVMRWLRSLPSARREEWLADATAEFTAEAPEASGGTEA
jgi:hypothetical protein